MRLDVALFEAAYRIQVAVGFANCMNDKTTQKRLISWRAYFGCLVAAGWGGRRRRRGFKNKQKKGINIFKKKRGAWG